MAQADEIQVSEAVGEREIMFRRLFDAPRDLVFKAWTDSDMLMQWWGPPEWPLAVSKLDLRPGGRWHYCMREKGGTAESWGIITYVEIAPPERLVFRDAFSDAAGATIPPESTSTVIFEDRDGKTLVTSTTLYATGAERDSVIEMGVLQGMNASLDRLVELLAAS